MTQTDGQARCNEETEFMPDSWEACRDAASAMGWEARDEAAEAHDAGMLDDGAPLCGVDARGGDWQVRWQSQGTKASTYGPDAQGDPQQGWQAVCRPFSSANAPPPPPEEYERPSPGKRAAQSASSCFSAAAISRRLASVSTLSAVEV